jgi:hypothetical protein
MNRTLSSPFGGDRAGELHKSFVEGVNWPIDRASLAALLDLGLTTQQIAQYFSVTPVEVERLKHSVASAGIAPFVDSTAPSRHPLRKF